MKTVLSCAACGETFRGKETRVGSIGRTPSIKASFRREQLSTAVAYQIRSASAELIPERIHRRLLDGLEIANGLGECPAARGSNSFISAAVAHLREGRTFPVVDLSMSLWYQTCFNSISGVTIEPA